VSDEIEGILRLSRSEEHEPVNIGNPDEFTVLECAREVLAVTGSSSGIEFCPLPTDDPRQRCPDITKARTLLQWQPTISLHTGIRLTLDYFRAALAAARVESVLGPSAVFDHVSAETGDNRV
jgi:dTDP-glucose 4,6-dehydratase